MISPSGLGRGTIIPVFLLLLNHAPLQGIWRCHAFSSQGWRFQLDLPSRRTIKKHSGYNHVPHTQDTKRIGVDKVLLETMVERGVYVFWHHFLSTHDCLHEVSRYKDMNETKESADDVMILKKKITVNAVDITLKVASRLAGNISTIRNRLSWHYPLVFYFTKLS